MVQRLTLGFEVLRPPVQHDRRVAKIPHQVHRLPPATFGLVGPLGYTIRHTRIVPPRQVRESQFTDVQKTWFTNLDGMS